MGDSVSESRLCQLEHELGRSEVCPGAACPFWEGAGELGDCAFERVDFAGRRDFALWLSGWRAVLATGGDEAREEAKRLFFERLNAGEGD